MNFAKRELMKYGWKEGSGLGKEATGIEKPVRPKLKFDTKGFGYDYGKEYTFNWWEQVYDRAAANICVHSAEDGSQIPFKTKCKKSIERNNQKNEVNTLSSHKLKSFIKGATLENNVEINDKTEENYQRKKNCFRENLKYQKTNSVDKYRSTKRKAKISGKQARLLLQEQQFLNSVT